MVFFFYLLLNVITVLLFVKRKKKENLNILEVVVYWLVSTYFYQNFSAFCFMNIKKLIVPNELLMEYTHFLNRLVLFPLVMVFFIHFFVLSDGYLPKALWIFVYINILVGLEWMSDFLGVLKHHDFKIWWSYAFWFSSLILLIIFMKIFRKILYKEGVRI